jgi:hypothetical protein
VVAQWCVADQSHRLQVDVPKNKKARVIDHSGFCVVAGAGIEPINILRYVEVSGDSATQYKSSYYVDCSHSAICFDIPR